MLQDYFGQNGGHLAGQRQQLVLALGLRQGSVRQGEQQEGDLEMVAHGGGGALDADAGCPTRQDTGRFGGAPQC